MQSLETSSSLKTHKNVSLKMHKNVTSFKHSKGTLPEPSLSLEMSYLESLTHYGLEESQAGSQSARSLPLNRSQKEPANQMPVTLSLTPFLKNSDLA